MMWAIRLKYEINGSIYVVFVSHMSTVPAQPSRKPKIIQTSRHLKAAPTKPPVPPETKYIPRIISYPITVI